MAADATGRDTPKRRRKTFRCHCCGQEKPFYWEKFIDAVYSFTVVLCVKLEQVGKGFLLYTARYLPVLDTMTVSASYLPRG